MRLTREQRRMALRPYREEAFQWQSSPGDAWSDSICHGIGVMEVLYHADAPLDPRWGFRHGMFRDDPIGDWHPDDAPCKLGCDEYCEPDRHACCTCDEERFYVPFLDAGEMGIEMLTYAASVLDRYASLLDHAGRSY